MSALRKGFPGRFPKGLRVTPVMNGKYRVAMSADFAQLECDFTIDEVRTMAAHLIDVVTMVNLTTFNHAPTKENVDIEDEEARA